MAEQIASLHDWGVLTLFPHHFQWHIQDLGHTLRYVVKLDAFGYQSI